MSRLILHFCCFQESNIGRAPPIIKCLDRNVPVEIPAFSVLTRNGLGKSTKESVLNKDTSLNLNTETTESFQKDPSNWDVLVKETLRPVHQSLNSNVVSGYMHSTRNPFVKYIQHVQSPPFQNHKNHASNADKTEMKNHEEETMTKILQTAIRFMKGGKDYFGKNGGNILEHVFLNKGLPTAAHTLENNDINKEDNNVSSLLVQFQPPDLRVHDVGINRFDANEEVDMKPNSKGVQGEYFRTDANHNLVSDNHKSDKGKEDILLNVGRIASFMNKNIKLEKQKKKNKNRKTRSAFDSIAHQGAFGGFRGYGAVSGPQKKRPFTFRELLPFLIREMRRKNRNASYHRSLKFCP